MKRFKSKIASIFLSISIFGLFLIASHSDFSIFHNDILQIIKVSQSMQWGEFSSYYNGIYPFFYLALVKLFIQWSLPLLICLLMVNFIFYRLFADVLIHKKYLPKLPIWASLLMLLAIVSDLNLFEYFITAGAYIPFVCSAGAGMILLSYSIENQSKKSLHKALILLVLASLIRYHGVLILGIMTVLILSQQDYRKFAMKSLLTAVGLLMLWMMATSYAATGNLLSSSHELMTKAVIDWNAMSPQYEFEKITLYNFMRNYLDLFMDFILYLIPFLLYILFSPRDRRLDLIALTCIFYYILISMHSSARRILVVIPFSIYFSAYIFSRPALEQGLKIQGKWIQLAFTLVFLILGVKFFLGGKIEKVQMAKEQDQTFKNIESKLSQLDSNFTSQQVYSNDFNFYFPRRLPHQEIMNGGWAKLDPKVYKNFPNPNISDMPTFYKSLKTMGIKYILKSQKALTQELKRGKTMQPFAKLCDSDRLQLIQKFGKDHYLYKL